VSIVLDSIKLGYHNVSQTGSAPVLRCIKLGGGRLKDKKRLKWNKPTQLGPLEGTNLNQWVLQELFVTTGYVYEKDISGIDDKTQNIQVT
jgi:hypothetical protein